MRPMMRCCAAGLIALLFVSCGGSRHTSLSGKGSVDTLAAAADSTESAACDGIFIEKHARLVVEIGKREQGGAFDARVVEARSHVDAGEELYLMGMTTAAIRLLDEAVRILE
jgi:hypothetical protein